MNRRAVHTTRPHDSAENPANARPAASQVESEPARDSASNDRRRRRIGASQALGVLAAVIGVLVGITTLTDWFSARTKHNPPPAIDTRIVSAKREESRMSLADFLRSNGQSARGLTPEQAREVGMIFAVRVRLKGDLGTSIPLDWRMFTGSGHALSDPIYRQRAGKLTPAAQNHARTVQLWIPFPPRPGRYYVQFKLVDKQSRPLDVANAKFVVTQVPNLR